MTAIDPTARVDSGAVIGPDVTIGPYCVIGPQCRRSATAAGCIAHVHVTGHTTIGARTVIYPFASLGTPPQSVKYRGGPTRLVIGADCDIRESVTMNTGTEEGGGVTAVGDRCLFMVGSHVGTRLPGRQRGDLRQQRRARRPCHGWQITSSWGAERRCISSCASARVR